MHSVDGNGMYSSDEIAEAMLSSSMIAVVQERDTVWKLSELLRFLMNVGQLDKRMLYVMYETYACKTYVKQLLFVSKTVLCVHWTFI